MAITFSKTEAHWNYFLAIEGDLERLWRFIEFDERSFDCFLIEISQILLASAAEVDIVCKQICKQLNPASSANGVNRYRDEIRTVYSAIPEFKVLLPRHGLRWTPWANWCDPRGVPIWWTAYNKIKHHRVTEYPWANLNNALNAVSGLFVMVLYLYKEKAKLGEIVPPPRLMNVSEERIGGGTHWGYNFSIVHNL